MYWGAKYEAFSRQARIEDKLDTHLMKPRGLAIGGWQPREKLLVADEDHRVVVMESNGKVRDLAGVWGMPGFQDGRGSQARFNSPRGLVSLKGTVYVCDGRNHRLRRINSQGEVTTVIGANIPTDTFLPLNSGESGSVETARLCAPSGITSVTVPMPAPQLPAHYLFIADSGAHTIRALKVTHSSNSTEDHQEEYGEVWSVAGQGREGDSDGLGSFAAFHWPVDISGRYTRLSADKFTAEAKTETETGSLSSQQNNHLLGGEIELYIADRANIKLRRISIPVGTDGRLGDANVTSVNLYSKYIGDDEDRLASHLRNPTSVKAGSSCVYFVDDGQLRAFDPKDGATWNIDSRQREDGSKASRISFAPRPLVEFLEPSALAVETTRARDTWIYVGDLGYECVKKTSPDGRVVLDLTRQMTIEEALEIMRNKQNACC
mmetsp:Transcript_18784/g.33616  ORF Transcript_18784/g.33616 Transcript_18784/m.33616 type:complete len:434 (-) Transcript_18784:203-1504(-)|eukprot:CAMPEP_0197539792 /NCGR_PEP_ID=MMETSP1318-20131121/63812_1 /TAXON_ID=552666 /ORGANISM="Partenskyella glossopodia, Strain RCC365" /LENGTH=433 /DNA_ID=CAMNT_0043098597 /DNA_START=160 /DNA_END=1461 /DNA_ORIENTATION=-